jgi:hypothetical protein
MDDKIDSQHTAVHEVRKTSIVESINLNKNIDAK